MRKEKQEKLHLRNERKNSALKKDNIPTWVDLNAKLQKQVTQISEYVEGNRQKAVSRMDRIQQDEPNKEHCDTSRSAAGVRSRRR